MQQVPHVPGFDSSLAFLGNGYRFISDHCRRFQSDIFQTRIMLRPVYCVTGAEAARMFYEPGRFTRVGAMPPTTLSLLQDHGSVLTLDDAEHARRKEMFMALMGPARLAELVELFESHWQRRLPHWQSKPQIRLQDELEEVLCASVCRWVGLNLSGRGAHLRTLELRAMIEGAGSVGPRNWNAQLVRQRTEHWARQQIREARAKTDDDSSPLRIIARHTGPFGHIPDYRTAAVELLKSAVHMLGRAHALPGTAAGPEHSAVAYAGGHQEPLCHRPDNTGPSQLIDRPLAMLGINTFVAETRDEAR